MQTKLLLDPGPKFAFSNDEITEENWKYSNFDIIPLASKALSFLKIGPIINKTTFFKVYFFFVTFSVERIIQMIRKIMIQEDYSEYKGGVVQCLM